MKWVDMTPFPVSVTLPNLWKLSQWTWLHQLLYFVFFKVYASVLCSTTHNSQRAETMPISRWMDKQNVVHTYNKIIVKKRSEHRWHMPCYNIDWYENIMLSELNTKGEIFFPSLKWNICYILSLQWLILFLLLL